MKHGPGTPHERLSIGDTFEAHGLTLTVIRDGEAGTMPPFGQPVTRYWCRCDATGAEGFMSYGPGGVLSAV